MIEVAVQSELQKAREATLHQATNESLWGIVAGLNPLPTDRIIAIAGSGDQPFALLESGARIVALDMNPSQITYMRLRAEALAQGNDEAFLEGSSVILKNSSYFDSQRLSRIKNNLQNLVIAPPEDIVSYMTREKEKCTKVYLSNCFDGRNEKDLFKSLKEISAKVAREGLMYTAEDCINPKTQRGKLQAIGLELDAEQTRKAWNAERKSGQEGILMWNPKVYRKVI